MPPPILLLTRPEAAARRFAAGLDLPGLRVVISPVLRILPVAHDAAALARAPGLVLTSIHALPAAGPGRGRPALCVGPGTAEAAREAGFAVTRGPGDARGLLPMLRGIPPGWLHPHGRHVARALPVPGVVVYDQVAQPLDAAGRAVLAGEGPVILPLFSPRSARLLAGQAEGARAVLWLVGISAAALSAWDAAGGPVPAVRLGAETPDAEAMRLAIARLLPKEQSP
ncbi:MAG: uroporphyrinogen-III synthase [Paracoccus sp. (in: a-proteobacteria)]|uniref:uroporphyrinogen-III synthase n=1 Tax=Paracoccus sp. TaxID=267 RepID=UPI0039E6D570